MRSHVASYGSGDRHTGPNQGDGLKVGPSWGWDSQINPGGLAGRKPWRQVDEPQARMPLDPGHRLGQLVRAKRFLTLITRAGSAVTGRSG